MKSSSFDRLFGFSPTTTKRYVAFWGLKLGNSLLSYHDDQLEIYVAFWGLKLGNSLLSYHDDQLEMYVVFLEFIAGETIALLPQRRAT